MRKIKRPKLGEYVLVSRWGDKDPVDPWYVGFISAVIENDKDMLYQVKGSNRYWKNVFRISEEEGREWLKIYS